MGTQPGAKAETMRATQRQSKKDTQSTVAVLEHLSGPSIGLKTLLYSNRLDISLDPDRLLTVKKTPEDDSSETTVKLIARLVRTGGTYRLERFGGCHIWVNGRRFDSILPEYGGSNLGVPAHRLRKLIVKAGIKLNARLDSQ